MITVLIIKIGTTSIRGLKKCLPLFLSYK